MRCEAGEQSSLVSCRSLVKSGGSGVENISQYESRADPSCRAAPLLSSTDRWEEEEEYDRRCCPARESGEVRGDSDLAKDLLPFRFFLDFLCCFACWRSFAFACFLDKRVSFSSRSVR